MPRRHIACQRDGQAARLIRNKCRGRVTRRPYVRLRSLAYVTRSRPRGSIGSPPGRGAEAHADRSAPDWAWTRVGTEPLPGSCSRPVYVPSWDLGTPLWAARTPYGGGGGPDPIPGVRLAHVEARDQPWGSGLYIRGSDALPWGSGPLLTPWSISPSLDMWRLRTRPCGGVGRRCGPRVAAQDWGKSWSGPTHSTFTTRLSDSRVGTVSLYSSKGYPSFRVPTVAPGPTLGEDASLQVGPKLLLRVNMA
jgi:hypothetical protein